VQAAIREQTGLWWVDGGRSEPTWKAKGVEFVLDKFLRCCLMLAASGRTGLSMSRISGQRRDAATLPGRLRTILLFVYSFIAYGSSKNWIKHYKSGLIHWQSHHINHIINRIKKEQKCVKWIPEPTMQS